MRPNPKLVLNCLAVQGDTLSVELSRTWFYADNKGYAVGYGYNPTQNSKEYNKSILDYAGVDENTKQVILKNAEKYKNQ